MNFNRFDFRQYITRQVENFAKTYALEKKIGISTFYTSDCLEDREGEYFIVGKHKKENFPGYLVKSRSWLSQGYLSNEVIAVLDQKIKEATTLPKKIDDEDILFHLSFVRNYSRSSSNHWHGLNCRARLKGKDYYEWLDIAEDHADRLIECFDL